MTPSDDPAIGQCRLCLYTKELRFSHIIPNLFFRKLKHDSGGGQFVYFSMEGKGEVREDQETWQEYLFCKGCEAIFEKYETYVSQLLYYQKAGDICHVNTKNKRILRGIQPELFKLFQLSILWRAGVSSLPIFQRILLSEDEQEFLRKVLRHESVYLFDQYWCDISTYYDRTKLLKESTHFIIQPTIEVKKGQIYYLFVFGGYVWTFYMSHVMPKPIKVKLFRDEGKYIIPKYDMYKIPAIRETIKRAVQMGLFSPSKVPRKWKHHI